MSATLARLELLVRARYSLVVLDTIEPELAERTIRQIASNLSLHYYTWTRSKGLRRGQRRGWRRILARVRDLPLPPAGPAR